MTEDNGPLRSISPPKALERYDPITMSAPTPELPPLPIRLLPGGANQFPAGVAPAEVKRLFHGALYRQLQGDVQECLTSAK